MWLLTSMIVIWGVSPGPVTIMTVQNARKHGRRSGIAVACGATLMAALVTIAALLIESLGFREAVASSRFYFVEQAGASGIVLMGLLAGCKTLWPAGHKNRATIRETGARRGFLQGMMIGATYLPQALVFFTMIVPETIGAGSATNAILFLGGLRVCLNLAYHSLIAMAATKAQGWLKNNRFEKWLELAASILMVGIGANVLLAS
jgi:threonine/homoserine/homoserine lactone efflux protein